MFTEPRVLRSTQETYSRDLHRLLEPTVLPESILADHEIQEYLHLSSYLEEARP